MTNTQKTQLQTAALFLAPNLLGFFVFTFGPILISLAGSFSTWSLRPAVPLRFIGLRNYVELFADANFYFYLFNTIYMLLALPIGIAGSLGLAVLLSQKLDLQRSGPRAQARLALAALILSLVTAGLVACLGMKNLALILGSLGCVTSIGLYFGSVGYRTIYYLPTFTAGAGTILLWTQLFNPNFGLLNQVWEQTMQFFGWQVAPPGWLTSTKCLLGFMPMPKSFNNGGFGIGAREAIMFMGLWSAIGGNNLILYLAGLANIPPELYEAADIDGASSWQRFWHITLPQLAPTTFFITVMSVIGGLQGGFEQARLMTQGGPAGTTTTLSYYIYTQGFERLDLGYGAAVAWVLFFLILVITLMQWKRGNRSLEN